MSGEILYYQVSNTVIGCQPGSYEHELRERQNCRRVADADGSPLATEKPAKEAKKAAPKKAAEKPAKDSEGDA